MSQLLGHDAGDSELEAQLRAAAPIIPPALRSHTLMRCAAQREAKRRNRRRGHWRWAWTFAVLGAFHWGTNSLLDAQNAALINGKTPPALVANVSTSIAELRIALETRTHPPAALTQVIDKAPENIRRAG